MRRENLHAIFLGKVLAFFFLIGISFSIQAQNTLSIQVEGVRSSEGYIAVGVYSDETGFLKEEKAFAGVFTKAEKGTTYVELPDLPDNTYAICIFHDENGNKKMDTNFIGIPKEAIGFSIGKLKTFGPPSFEECSFLLKNDFEIKIPIK